MFFLAFRKVMLTCEDTGSPLGPPQRGSNGERSRVFTPQNCDTPRVEPLINSFVTGVAVGKSTPAPTELTVLKQQSESVTSGAQYVGLLGEVSGETVTSGAQYVGLLGEVGGGTISSGNQYLGLLDEVDVRTTTTGNQHAELLVERYKSGQSQPSFEDLRCVLGSSRALTTEVLKPNSAEQQQQKIQREVAELNSHIRGALQRISSDFIEETLEILESAVSGFMDNDVREMISNTIPQLSQIAVVFQKQSDDRKQLEMVDRFQLRLGNILCKFHTCELSYVTEGSGQNIASNKASKMKAINTQIVSDDRTRSPKVNCDDSQAVYGPHHSSRHSSDEQCRMTSLRSSGGDGQGCDDTNNISCDLHQQSDTTTNVSVLMPVSSLETNQNSSRRSSSNSHCLFDPDSMQGNFGVIQLRKAGEPRNVGVYNQKRDARFLGGEGTFDDEQPLDLSMHKSAA